MTEVELSSWNALVSDLESAANANLLNIGTADFLVQKQNADAPTPGELINWALRFDMLALELKIADLKKLLAEYDEIATAKNIDAIEAGWDGMGAQVFIYRWKEFQEYLGTDSPGLQNVLNEQIQSMEAVRTTAEEFIKGCTDDINNELCKVRKQFVKALCSDSDISALMSAVGITGLGEIVPAILEIFKTYYDANKERLEKLAELGDAGTEGVAERDDVMFSVDTPEPSKFSPPDNPPVGSDYNFDDQDWVTKLWCFHPFETYCVSSLRRRKPDRPGCEPHRQGLASVS